MFFEPCDIIDSPPPIVHERIVKSHDGHKKKKKYDKYISPLNTLMKDLYHQKNVDAADAVSTLYTIREYLIKVYKLDHYRKKRFSEELFCRPGSFTET